MLAYMFWSDATHLAQFGQAKAWPIYGLIGNISKYTRCRPSEHSAQYVAFVPPVSTTVPRFNCMLTMKFWVSQLPDDFPDQLRKLGVKPTAELLTHCKRELFQGVWRLILDDEFRSAYIHGIVVKCGDGVTRRLFFRFMIYAADYPEK